jgi:hypothetical protein
MSLCENLIIANSTFSWWAAWLCKFHKKIIIAPNQIINGKTTNWGFNGLIPDSWIKL